MSILDGGRIKPGIYKIQNIQSQTYLEIRENAKELCCRPAAALEDGKGLWEILPSGIGYTIRRLESGMPEQFCIMLTGLGDECIVSVAPFSVAWRVETVNDERHPGCEYVRFFWGTTDMHWDLAGFGSSEDRTYVQLKDKTYGHDLCCRMWKLLPVQLRDGSLPTPTTAPAAGSHSSPPSYDGNSGNHPSQQTAETSDDGFGTTVVEFNTTTTTTTNTVTTRKKYRVEGG